MFGKISIRNIPHQIWVALEALAVEHDRSTEAEARHALRSWVEPSLLAHERSSRRTEVATRLRNLLEQINSTPLGARMRPSHLAQAIGEDYAEAVEDWFTGQAEPSFSQLKATAKHMGAVVEWLQHGDGHMFPVSSHRLSDDATEAATWLLTWDEEEPGTNVKTVHFVREASNTGSLLVVKESINGHYKTFSTQYHVSDQIGAGGESALAHLWVTLELLYKHYTRGGVGFMVKSCLLKPSEFESLWKGNTNPQAILHGCINAPWWEDIWDKHMFPKNDYWHGWKQLCESIGSSIESRPHLVEERDKIRKGEHHFLRK
jgi:plasmid stability protein